VLKVKLNKLYNSWSDKTFSVPLWIEHLTFLMESHLKLRLQFLLYMISALYRYPILWPHYFPSYPYSGVIKWGCWLLYSPDSTWEEKQEEMWHAAPWFLRIYRLYTIYPTRSTNTQSIWIEMNNFLKFELISSKFLKLENLINYQVIQNQIHRGVKTSIQNNFTFKEICFILKIVFVKLLIYKIPISLLYKIWLIIFRLHKKMCIF